MASFTAEAVIADALDQATEFRRAPVSPDAMARAFNDALHSLLGEVLEADPERIITAIPIPASVVGAYATYVDLTDDGEGGEREFLHVEHIDWVSDPGAGPVDEVYLLPIADRHTVDDVDWDVIGMLTNGWERLEKLRGWDAVAALEVLGLLAPQEVTGRTLASVTFRYPRDVRRAMVWEIVPWLASHAGIIDPSRRRDWETSRRSARERLGLAATRPVGGRVESVPIRVE